LFTAERQSQSAIGGVSRIENFGRRFVQESKFVVNVLLFCDIMKKYALPPFGRGRYNDVGQVTETTYYSIINTRKSG
jgi:hypothetical protein